MFASSDHVSEQPELLWLTSLGLSTSSTSSVPICCLPYAKTVGRQGEAGLAPAPGWLCLSQLQSRRLSETPELSQKAWSSVLMLLVTTEVMFTLNWSWIANSGGKVRVPFLPPNSEADKMEGKTGFSALPQQVSRWLSGGFLPGNTGYQGNSMDTWGWDLVGRLRNMTQERILYWYS